ncbi:uncharacterized protein NECHADRAFT_84738 [Fusarium vanettenii 77-13-4]|uniref:Uncharacterized protein n=1 Tax=Fusarium vanettenii (strain ATCC MYA-4622 / CBS 123669 / FGSC 9596 / NRRL 45880 / 77-13-4) TaxID=660122 RepID=C7YTY4_FUSV7|nr:uncharacterized protein NECHADRAFT_84738 [Fusarium vanettenii 77-13-4]EEU44703.1 predicted protein [Fusarium vanettenii 77-13-4]
MEERVIEQAEQIRNLEGGIRTVLEILRRNEEISRPSSISSSSSSSVESYLSSTSQPTPVGDGAEALTEGDQNANAFSEIIENLSVLDNFFDYFIMGSDHTTLVERSERIQASSAAFVEAATEQLGSYMGETEAETIIAQLSSLDGEQIIDVYIGLSHRNRSSKSQGEMTITATEISHTDSQST